MKPFTKHPDLFTKRLLRNDSFTKRLALIHLTESAVKRDPHLELLIVSEHVSEWVGGGF